MEAGTVETLSKWRINRPAVQNVIMGVILFCLPGIYLALTGLGAGGGGPGALHVAINTNAILYGLFTVFGWIGGTILNLMKPKATVIFGGFGYPLYVGSLWYFDRRGHDWFPYLSGALLGVTAGCLWTAASFIAWTYPEEKDKGKYIAIQWGLTSLGGTVGASVAFGISADKTDATGVSDPVYIVFVVIMCCAIVAAALCIKHPASIVRDDGTHLAEFKPTNTRAELRNLKKTFTDWKLLALTPAFFASEMCLSTTSSLNSYYFDLRTRSLNNVLFQAIMIAGSVGMSFLLDAQHLSRRRRGLIACVTVGVITMGAAAGLIGWMKKYGLDGRLETPPAVDWTNGRFAGGVILYLLWGIVYSTYLCSAGWVVGSLSNDPVVIAMYSGFTKGMGSLGLCVCFVMDSQSVTYMTQAIVQLVLYGVGSLTLIYVVVFYLKDTNYFLEESVVVPLHIQQEKHVAIEALEVPADTEEVSATVSGKTE
ncbi:hypothetical protein AYL99_00531 [Fonsecaea erecta]|uniref:Uncharacterized protein n=1 Tax=Fonsecaea erecta TaxID=1367422 RepID=A0A178ZXL9_9EURO|nr:hypothetical protein AYL99_00531 [Fonsecaea erecta]OAP64559.1 hypothetical protein AYL99_00531 [Fonsecaea erecta]